MQLIRSVTAIAMVITSASAFGADEVSVERGALVAIIGGCHDCHTEGYTESEGKIDPKKALMGSRVGWQGPWGTSYAQNLRMLAKRLTEDGFVSNLKSLRADPPMPWYNVRALPENDMRSLYQYIKSLGDPGELTDVFVPAFVPPGEQPKTPFIVLAPPQMPEPCSRDLDCGVGEICSTGAVRQCVAK